MLRDHVLRDEARRARPFGRRPVERVVEGEAVRVLGGQRLELRADEDVALGLVRKDELPRRLVAGVRERGRDDLVHGRDARAAGHHAHGFRLDRSSAVDPRPAALVLDHADRALEREVVADLEAAEVLRHLAAVREPVDDAARVDLNHQVRHSEVRLGRGRRVRPLDLRRAVLGVVAAVPLARDDARRVRAEDLHVLAQGQAERLLRVGQSEAKELGVVRQLLDLGERERLAFPFEKRLRLAQHEE
mmetsp:Transcript_33343/g.103303  ORF Transcript_33343/g.103303 Transcript_33343/m.103303 type:complete len:246 (+) Transcript_33343:186-923(+)